MSPANFSGAVRFLHNETRWLVFVQFRPFGLYALTDATPGANGLERGVESTPTTKLLQQNQLRFTGSQSLVGLVAGLTR